MAETDGTTRAARLGQWVGRQWRKYARREEKVLRWLKGKGLSEPIAKILKWTIQLSLLLMLLYLAFWAAVIAVFIFVAARSLGGSTTETEEWVIGEQNEHRDNSFYDPINYTDSVDPRFDDD